MNILIPILLSLLIFILTYIYFQYSFTYWSRNNVPSFPGIFPFGNMRRVILRQKSINEKVNEIYRAMRKTGNSHYAGLYFFSRPVFLAISPELVKGILAADFAHFADRGIYYDEENDPVSAHMFSLSGARWKRLRAKLTPAFTGGRVKYMFGAIAKCGEDMRRVLWEEMDVQGCVDIKDVLARFTTDVIGSCAFGLECNSLKNPEAEFRRMGRRAFTQTRIDLFKMVIIRSFPWLAKILRLGVFARSVSNFFRKVVDETISYRCANNIVRPDFLQLLIQLMQTGKLEDESFDKSNKVEDNIKSDVITDALTMDEAAAQAFIFFLAGFETTSTTISFALLELALNEEFQEKARQEISEVVGRYNGDLSYEAIAELTYLEMIVLESLRKYPPAPVFLRKCTKDYCIPDSNVVIKSGLSVLIPAMALQNDPEFFPKPEEFNPERFNRTNKSQIMDYTYLPFGDGPRICIGMRFAMVQSKLALALILRHFRFTLSEKTQLPLDMEKKGIVLTPIGGIWINFKKIEY